VANYDTSHHTVHGAKPGSAHLTNGILKNIDKWHQKKLKPVRDNFFLWAHYYDPHDPYFKVPGYPAKDDSDKSRYEAILRYVDHEIGRLVDGLKKRGLWEKTLLVLTADHGDEFYDHGHRFHGSTLYEEMTHVPLILHVPGVRPREFSGAIGHVEVAPTVLELLGVPIPKKFEGRSRAAEIMSGREAKEEPVFLEVFPDANYSGHQVGLRSGDLKLIYRLSDNYFELYDLKADPQERRNRVDDHPQAEALKTLLGRYVDRHLFVLAQGRTGAKRPPGSPPKKKVSKKSKRRRKPAKKVIKGPLRSRSIKSVKRVTVPRPIPPRSQPSTQPAAKRPKSPGK